VLRGHVLLVLLRQALRHHVPSVLRRQEMQLRRSGSAAARSIRRGERAG
jgi:hypothetical protein